MSCKCHQCGRQYKIDVQVENNLWEMIKPDGSEKGSGMLCPTCIMSGVERVIEEYQNDLITDFGMDVDDVGYASFDLKGTWHIFN